MSGHCIFSRARSFRCTILAWGLFFKGRSHERGRVLVRRLLQTASRGDSGGESAAPRLPRLSAAHSKPTPSAWAMDWRGRSPVPTLSVHPCRPHFAQHGPGALHARRNRLGALRRPTHSGAARSNRHHSATRSPGFRLASR